MKKMDFNQVNRTSRICIFTYDVKRERSETLAMKPLTVKQLRIAINGELIQGSDDVIVRHGAYRIKQVKKQNTVLFFKKENC